MKDLITSDNLTFTKKKCNCGLKSNNVDIKGTTNMKDTNKKKVSTKKRKTKSRRK